MNFLISFCLNNRITVILLTIALAIISIFVVKNIPVDVFPELKVPRVTIQTPPALLRKKWNNTSPFPLSPP